MIPLRGKDAHLKIPRRALKESVRNNIYVVYCVLTDDVLRRSNTCRHFIEDETTGKHQLFPSPGILCILTGVFCQLLLGIATL